MKIMLIILGAAAVIVAGLLLVVRLGISTTKHLIAEYAEGSDRLTLEYHHTSDWGNSRTAMVLLFNGKLVDFRGMLRGHENEGHKVFPVRAVDARQLVPEIVDEKNALPLSAFERLRRVSLSGSEEYKAIQAQHEEVRKWVPWTLWVNPADFSNLQYERINAMLRKGGGDLLAQQRRAKTNLSSRELSIHDWNNEEPYAIWRTVYFDYARLKNEVFERRAAGKEERIEISPGGFAGFRHKSEKYVAGFGCALGLLNDTGETLVVSRTWKHTDEAFPVSELSAFRDAQGRSLMDVYRVLEEADVPDQQN